MNYDWLEAELRNHLARRPAPDGFTRRVMDRLARREYSRRRRPSALLAVAAVLLIAIGAEVGQQALRRHSVLQARQTEEHLAFALELTASKLAKVDARLRRAAPVVRVPVQVESER